MKRLLRLLALAFLCVGLVSAQTAVVKRNVNLRSDPSTANDPVAKLTSGAQLQLLEPDATAGYYHVRTADGESGWVWGRNITVQASADTNTPPTSSTPSATTTPNTTTPTNDSDLFGLLFAARVPAIGQPLIENQHAVCGAEGDATDQLPPSSL